MFERFTEKARRTIFFARYEASQFGSQYIESGHLLLGLLRDLTGNYTASLAVCVGFEVAAAAIVLTRRRATAT